MANFKQYSAFIDETGTHALDTAGSLESHLFICTAILVDTGAVGGVSEGISDLSRRYFSGAEIKSKNIGKNHERRLKLLDAISRLDFRYYALIVNKNSVDGLSGLKFKKTFYKFINRMLYEKVARELVDLHIVADAIGGADYMRSYDEYLRKKLPNLFFTYTHEFRDSKTTPLLQLADLVSGSLGYCFDNSKISEYSGKFREILRPKEIDTYIWPPLRAVPIPVGDYEKNDAILISSRNRAIGFLGDSSSNADEYCRMQKAVVQKMMLHQFVESDSGGALSSSSLISHLVNLGFEKISEQAFRTKVIGRIRDAGLIIAGTSKGYRLAVSFQDIRDYLMHNKIIIEQMLKRMRRAQAVVKSDIGTDCDILKDQEFSVLKELLNCYIDSTLELSVG